MEGKNHARWRGPLLHWILADWSSFELAHTERGYTLRSQWAVLDPGLAWNIRAEWSFNGRPGIGIA
jgi:hypothetical protein